MFGFKLIRTQTLDDIISSYSGARAMLEQRDETIRELTTILKKEKFDLFVISKLIGFLQPMYAIPEDDPDRIAKSNELGEKVIKKLKDEFAVLNRGN